MNQALREQTQEALSKAQQLRERLDLSQLKADHSQLEEQTYTPDFWQRSDAQNIMQEISIAQEKITKIEQLETAIEDLQALSELDQETSDEEAETAELETEYTKAITRLEKHESFLRA